MRKLASFTNLSLDGFFTSSNGDLDWAYVGGDDPEFAAFIASNAQGGGALLLGRVTYEMMASYWPTPAAARDNGAVARGMNAMQKFVPSRTHSSLSWNNTTVLPGDFASEIRALKSEDGMGITVLGSGSLVAQLTNERLIDEYQVVINPVVIGAGRTMFDGIAANLPLRLTESRAFKNGKMFLRYALKT